MVTRSVLLSSLKKDGSFLLSNFLSEGAKRMNEIIQIQNLKKTFVSDHNTVTALDGIDLSIEKGEIFGIIG